MTQSFEAAKCPSDELSLTNQLFLNPEDVLNATTQHLVLQSGKGDFIFMLGTSPKMAKGTVGFSLVQRRWSNVSIGEKVFIKFSHKFDPRKCTIANVLVEADFLLKKNATNDPYNTDDMRVEFTQCFPQMPLTVGQELVFKYKDKRHLLLRAKELELLLPDGRTEEAKIGVVSGNTIVTFEKLSADSPT